MVGVAPDIETASADYATRFVGRSGAYMLERQSRCVEALLEKLEVRTALEVGAGHGQLLNVYERLGLQYTLHGSAEVCFSRLPPPTSAETRFVSKCHSLPMKDQSVDAVVAVRLISHLEDWQAALAEMCRVARRAVIFDYPSKRSLNALSPMLFRMKKNVERNTRNYESFHEKDFAPILGEQGFEKYEDSRQFFIPMVVHRMVDSAGWLRVTETIFRVAGITAMFGSPAIVCAIRRD